MYIYTVEAFSVSISPKELNSNLVCTAVCALRLCVQTLHYRIQSAMRFLDRSHMYMNTLQLLKCYIYLKEV